MPTAPATPRALGEWLDRLLELHPSEIELGLDRVQSVRKRLGLLSVGRRVVVVGGTNGKGSSVAMLEALADANGWSSAAYTSPHLLRYNERVRLRGAPASDAALCAAFERVEAARGEVPLTFFEFGTLAALDLISRSDVDLAILEVGLGGRLDAVNIIDGDASLVTSIDLDHMDWLGPDRETIGREKAGIFRPGRPAICADPDAPGSLRDVATAVGAAYGERGTEFSVTVAEANWALRTPWGDLNSLALPSPFARHRIDNAAGVLALALNLGWLPEPENLGRIINARPAGRLQQMGLRPQRVVDVGHNPAAGAALADWMANLDLEGRVHCVLGMLGDKDAAGFVRPLLPFVDQWYIASTPGSRGMAAAELAHRTGLDAAPRFDHVVEAWDGAVAIAGPEDLVLAAGSFTTAAAILEQSGIMADSQGA